MKKVIRLFLSLLLFILCVPCNVIYGDLEPAVLEINFCDANGNNNQHIIYENDEFVSYEWENSVDGEIEGLEVVPTCDENGVYTYTIKISDDINLFFNAFDAIGSSEQTQGAIENHRFSNCIYVYNACLKIESVDGNHTLAIRFKNKNFQEHREIYCIYNYGLRYKDTIEGCEYCAYFGGNDNQLTLNFYCDNYDENEINPIVGAFDIDSIPLSDGETSYYYVYFNNLKSTAILTGSYIKYNAPGNRSLMTIENDCDIDFTNIDPFDELPDFINDSYNRGFLRLNAEVKIIDSKINAHLNDTSIEINDRGDVTAQIPNVGIASNSNITFQDSEVHMEGIAAIATPGNIVIDNTKAEFIGRLAGIISISLNPDSIQYINPGSSSLLTIKTLEAGEKMYLMSGLSFNAAAAIAPGTKVSNLINDISAKGSKAIDGDEFKPLSDIESSEYDKLKRIKVGSPFDFEMRYGSHGDNTVSCKYYEGEPLDESITLPEDVSLSYYPESDDFPYVMNLSNSGNSVNIPCDINNKIAATHISENHDLGYCIYYDKGLLIQGDGLEFSFSVNPEEPIYYYGIISNNEDAKLKIDVPKLYFTPQFSDTDFESVEYKIEDDNYFDLPYLFGISGYDISINNVEEGRLMGLYSCIEYYKKLSFINSSLQVWLYPFKFVYSEDQNENLMLNMIMTNLEGEDYDSNDKAELIISGSELSFEGHSQVNKYNNNIDVNAIVSLNMNNIALSEFKVNDSKLKFEDVGLMLTKTTFEDCDELKFTNENKDFANITSYGGEISFINSNYEFNSKVSNIDYVDMGEEIKMRYDIGALTDYEFNLFYPLLHADFSLYFEQDRGHYGVFNSDAVCINTSEGSINKGDETKIEAWTMLDGSSVVEYDDADRLSYKYLSVDYCPTLKEIKLQIPMLDMPGYLPYYHDEKNGIYYLDPEGRYEIGDYDDLQEWINGEGAIAKLNGNSKYKASLINASSKTPTTKIKLPVEKNDYIFNTDINRLNFACVIINGKCVENVNYRIGKSKEGEIVFNFYDDFVNQLPAGTNKIYIACTDGNAYLEFEVEKTGSDPVNPTKPSKPSYNPPKTGIK